MNNPSPGESKVRAAARMQPGTKLNDRYQIDELAWSGVYGEVYRGRDLSDGRLVLLKLLHPQLILDERVRAQLEQQVKLAVDLDHKNIAQTFGMYGATVGSETVVYLVTESIDGQTLREMIEKKRADGRTFSVKGAYNVVAHLCNALGYAHVSMVHGALNPDSILVSSAGRVKVADWALGRALKAGALGELAPEMAKGGAVDGRADIYSTGVILYELLTGKAPGHPFERPSAVPGVPAAIDAVVEKCLQPRPEDRYADAQTLKEALASALADELAGGSTAAPAPAKPMPRPAAPPARPTPPGVAKPAAAAPSPILASSPAPSRVSSPAAQLPPVKRVDDDQSERWLIQKDKLDFGPFSLRDVRSQIESGKILGEHYIVDTETHKRHHVKDHPQLRELALNAEVRFAEKAREDAETKERSGQRRKVVTLLMMMFLLIAGVGGGVFWYVMHMKPKTVIVHDKEDLEFLKGMQITMKVDPPTKRPHSPSNATRHRNKNGKFDDVTNLGDASGEGGDDTLDQSVVQGVMSKNFQVLVGCIREERRRNASFHSVDMDFIIKGTGMVSAVKVNGQTNTPLAECMYGKMQSVAFPKFNGAKTHASFSLALK